MTLIAFTPSRRPPDVPIRTPTSLGSFRVRVSSIVRALRAYARVYMCMRTQTHPPRGFCSVSMSRLCAAVHVPEEAENVRDIGVRRRRRRRRRCRVKVLGILRLAAKARSQAHMHARANKVFWNSLATLQSSSHALSPQILPYFAFLNCATHVGKRKI